MITDAIVTALLAAVDALLTLLPSLTVPTVPVVSWASSFGGVVASAQRVIPLGDVVVVLTFAMLVAFSLALWDLGVFVYHQFWGAS